MRLRVLRRRFGWALLLWLVSSGVGCAALQAVRPTPHVSADVAGEPPSSIEEPPTDEEAASGRTFRDLIKPVELPCAAWTVRLRQAEGACARNLFVDECGEKDDNGKPTGKYAGTDCPACETLSGIRKQIADKGCGSG